MSKINKPVFKYQTYCTRNARKTSLNNFFYLSCLIFFLSLFLKVFITNNLAVKSSNLSQSLTQISNLEKEISELSLVRSENLSLLEIEKKAISLGFIENSNGIAKLDNSSSTALLTSF